MVGGIYCPGTGAMDVSGKGLSVAIRLFMALEKCAAYDACMHVYRVHVSSRRQRDFWTCLLCCQVVMTSS